MFTSIADMLKETEEKNIPLWKLIQKEDCREEGIREEISFSMMKRMYAAMVQTIEDYNPIQKSTSGLVGGEAAKLEKRILEGKMIAGDFISTIMKYALRTAESNACMHTIVAAPTAGSCGVVPAVLIAYQEKNKTEESKMIESLYIAAGIGGVIAARASLSGAEGGCQAEIGSASAMAAGALCYLEGGSPEEIVNAAALALKSLLGLACDPVAGLVEVPCVKRNVIGAVNAVTAVDMSMAGIESKVSPDEVIDAMKNIGNHMDSEIRETGKGGLALSTTAERIRRQLQES